MKYLLAGLFAPLLITLAVIIFFVFSIFFFLESMLENDSADLEGSSKNILHDLAAHISIQHRKHS